MKLCGIMWTTVVGDGRNELVFGRQFVKRRPQFVKRFALCYRTLVYCDQTVRWINMKLGTQTVLGPGHTVLDGDRAS